MTTIGTNVDQLNFASLREDVQRLYDAGCEALILPMKSANGPSLVAPIGPFSIVHFKLWRPLFVVVETDWSAGNHLIEQAIACGADAISVSGASVASLSAIRSRHLDVLVMGAEDHDWTSLSSSAPSAGRSDWVLIRVVGNIPLSLSQPRLQCILAGGGIPPSAFFFELPSTDAHRIPQLRTALAPLGTNNSSLPKRPAPGCFNVGEVTKIYSQLDAQLPSRFPVPEY